MWLLCNSLFLEAILPFILSFIFLDNIFFADSNEIIRICLPIVKLYEIQERRKDAVDQLILC